MYESSISIIELLDFKINQLQVRFLDFKNNIVLYFTISPIFRIGRLYTGIIYKDICGTRTGR
jgi:hypothetical protein